MVFGVKSYHTAYGCNRIIAVFQMLYRNVYLYGVLEAYWRLSKLVLEQMVKGRFANTAFFRKLTNAKALVPIFRDIFNCLLQSFVGGNV